MGYGQATAKNYALSLQNPNGSWRALDDLPVSQGITHGAFAVVGMKLYLCGGYVNANHVEVFGCSCAFAITL